MDSLGKFLVFTGILIIVVGVILMLAPRIPFIGRFPGDISIQGEKFSFHFPLATSLVISLLLTVILNIVIRLFGK